MSYLEKETRSLFGKAVHHYGLVKKGDRVAVALSGGKDSLALLWLLADRRGRVPIDFEIVAVWIDMGFEGFEGQALASFCQDLGLDLIRVRADWNPADFPSCYPCARLRLQRLFEAADQAGCRVVALGHNLDDLLETFFLNLVFNGQAAAYRPQESYFKGRFEVIRPLIMIPAAKLARFAQLKSLPVQEVKCGQAERSARARLKKELGGLYSLHRKARQNIFQALTRLDVQGLPPPLKTSGPDRPQETE